MDYQLWLGDCLEEMNRIEDGSIDMILADLPYGTTACKWDIVIPFEPLWKQYKRVIKKNGAIVLFGSQPFTSLLILSNFEWFKYEWIWEKNNCSGFILAKKQPLRNHENIAIFYLNQPTYNPIFEEYSRTTQERFKHNGKVNSSKMQSRNYKNRLQNIKRIDDEIDLGRGSYPKTVRYFDSVPNANNAKLHPTQKPVALLSYLIKTYTNEGDLILDNCAGSGSTLEAAMRCNRRSIGIEKDEGYYRIASQRLERVAADLRGELNHLPLFQEAAV